MAKELDATPPQTAAIADAPLVRLPVEHELLIALREIETIFTESAGDCRKRMGTRVGNVLVTARAAIAKATGAA